MAEQTLVIVKPDGVQRRLVGEVIGRLERKGLKIVAMKLAVLDRDTVEEQYKEHREKSFYTRLVTFMTSGPVVLMAVEGREAVAVVRALLGTTDSVDAARGTLRGDLGLSLTTNVVHGSRTIEDANREISLFFSDEEILQYSMPDDQWLG